MKINPKYYIILLLGLLLSCNSSSNNRNETIIENNKDLTKETTALEIEVIQSILDNKKKSGSKPPPPPPPLTDSFESKEDYYKRVELQIKEIHQKWDTTIFEFAISDTLNPIEIIYISELLDNSFVIDTTSSVFDKSVKTIDLNLIKQDGFKLIDIPYSNFKDFSKREEFHSILNFSKMLFNQDQSQVILCYSFSCGRLCGGSYALKLKKTKNGWKTVASTLFSVS